MVEQLTRDDVLHWRIRQHHLIGDPAPDAIAVAHRVCGVHAQLAASATTAIGLRSPATAAEIDAALDARTLVKTWAARGTLHLLPAAEYWTWVAVDVEGRPGHLRAERLDAVRSPSPGPAVHLLPAFDPYVVGSLRQLDEVVVGPNKARVSRPQGWISPVLVVDGRIAGIWTGDRRGDTLSITIEPFEPLARPVHAKLAGAADRVAVASGATGADLVVRADPI